MLEGLYLDPQPDQTGVGNGRPPWSASSVLQQVRTWERTFAAEASV